MDSNVGDNQKHTLEEALQQFVNLHLRGEVPDLEALVKNYPEHEQQIRKRLRKLNKINDLFDSLVQTDESEFEDTVAEQNLVGQTIGSFEITEMIGCGGMGIVYLARDTKLNRSVAVKSIPASLTGDSTARMRFRREAELLALLNHPNIAVIHEIIEQGEDSGYLVLEYVSGETLAERIARKPLELKEVLSIGRQIAEAISAAHKKGIMHRDLKPGNIKITPEGRVKVLDFGLAKAIISEAKSNEITETHPCRVIGTPAYMSPEQARGKDIDHRTDIWSFGCIMYQMLTAHLPFEGQTATDTLARIIEREPDWKALPNETPGNIRALLRRCLEKNPDQRLGNIADAAKEISETLSKPLTAPATKLRKIAMIVSAAIIIVVTAMVVRFIPHKQTQFSPKEIRLVVLPFENLGPAEDEYFADGITDAITARLAGIHGLGVISRQSAMQYKKRDVSIKKIAEELSVDFVLEGTVQREQPSDPTSRVRIIPQLINAFEDTHVWTDIYDDDMNELFNLQSEVAERVAQALDITLLEPERKALKARPTVVMEAYDYYLRGNEYFYRSYLENDIRIAIQMYEKAVELDSTFALAYSRLARAHVDLYWFLYDRTDERLVRAKKAADEAYRLNSNLPEVDIAMGWYYYHGDLDFNRSLKHFTTARKSQPNNSDLLHGIACVQRRLGKFEQALENFKKASELNPRSNSFVFEVANTCMFLRKYSEAERYYERSISLRPDWPEPYSWMAWMYVLAQGETEKAQMVLERASQNSDSLKDPWTVYKSVVINILDGSYQKAMSQLSSWTSEAFESQFYFVPKAQLYAQINGLMGNKQLEKEYYESARSFLEEKIKQQPEDPRYHSVLGIAYAGLGRKQDAIREGNLAVELLPVSKDALRGFYRAKDLAQIFTMVGEHEAAIDLIEDLLSIHGELAIPLLKLDPTWNPLHNHPRFLKLIESDK
jgi:serine/threonine protein kinase/tetratricopeptide (TPR) repeat protein